MSRGATSRSSGEDVGMVDVSILVRGRLINEARPAHKGTELPLEEEARQVDVGRSVDGELGEQLASRSRPHNVRGGLVDILGLAEAVAQLDCLLLVPPRHHIAAQIEKAGPLLGGNGALDALHQLARARQEVGTDDRVVLKDEHRRRGVAVCGACVPQNGVRHGAATLAVGHDQFGRQRARVVLAVNGRVPCASHDPRVGVGSGSRLQTPGLHTLLPHLRLDGAAAVHPTGQIDIHGDHERALPGRELLLLVHHSEHSLLLKRDVAQGVDACQLDGWPAR
mmetsp:Transcript_441/g.1242  ORF Transcript_441/g.1242 Transcript_441/m.1242 type:complete len:280 (-) Transcript_441:368-1207(-)